MVVSIFQSPSPHPGLGLKKKIQPHRLHPGKPPGSPTSHQLLYRLETPSFTMKFSRGWVYHHPKGVSPCFFNGSEVDFQGTFTCYTWVVSLCYGTFFRLGTSKQNGRSWLLGWWACASLSRDSRKHSSRWWFQPIWNKGLMKTSATIPFYYRFFVLQWRPNVSCPGWQIRTMADWKTIKLMIFNVIHLELSLSES